MQHRLAGKRRATRVGATSVRVSHFYNGHHVDCTLDSRSLGDVRCDCGKRPDTPAISQAGRRHDTSCRRSVTPATSGPSTATSSSGTDGTATSSRAAGTSSGLERGPASRPCVTCPALSSCAIPDVVRGRPRTAILRLRQHGIVRRSRCLLPRATQRSRQSRVRGTADAYVRGGPVSRGNDGVSTERDDQGLEVRGLGGISESPAWWAALAVSDDHHDRAASARNCKLVPSREVGVCHPRVHATLSNSLAVHRSGCARSAADGGVTRVSRGQAHHEPRSAGSPKTGDSVCTLRILPHIPRKETLT